MFAEFYRNQHQAQEIVAFEEKRLMININKTEYIQFQFGGRGQDVDRIRQVMTISSDVIGEADSFKYFESLVQKMVILTKI